MTSLNDVTEILDRVGLTRAETPSEMETYFDRLWPIMRSITGDGVRETHRILSEIVPLSTYEIPSGTEVFDWTIPPEWNFKDAYILNGRGEKIVDCKANNIQLLNYSTPFSGTMGLAELKEHLTTDPRDPDSIPYATSYYSRKWAFCVSRTFLEALPEDTYTVCVDTTLEDGSLTYSDHVLEGESKQEILFTSYSCHPSLANNELSGPLALFFLFRRLAAMPRRRYTYRLYLGPETIGAIAYLQKMGGHFLEHLKAGYVLSCVGDEKDISYKRSRDGDSYADTIAECAQSIMFGTGADSRDFWPTGGSDERQFCSPGFNLPFGGICRSFYGEYPEYHSSRDNKDVMSFPKLQESVDFACLCVALAELDLVFERVTMFGELQLGKHGLYADLVPDERKAVLWFTNLADGRHTLQQMAARSGVPFARMAKVAALCLEKGLVRVITD